MVDSLQLEAFEKNRVLAALGPPGTGKTLVLNRCIRRWQARGARILFALPTGQLAAEMRRKHPDVDVDTCHGAFLFHKEISQALPLLSAYDLVVVDEVSMLTAEHFDRLFAMWQAADRLPCLVFLGDFWQLPGPQKPPSKVTTVWRGGTWLRSTFPLPWSIAARIPSCGASSAPCGLPFRAPSCSRRSPTGPIVPGRAPSLTPGMFCRCFGGPTTRQRWSRALARAPCS